MSAKISAPTQQAAWRVLIPGAWLTLCVPAVALLLHLLPYGHDFQRRTELVFLTAVVLYVGIRPSLLAWPRRFPAGYALGVFFLAGLLSSLFAYVPSLALLEVGMLFLLFVTGWSMGREMQTSYERSLLWVLTLVAVGCAAYVLQAGIGYAMFLGMGRMPEVGDLIQNFANYRSFNYAQTISLPMLAMLCCLAKRPLVRLLAIGLTTCWWVLVLATAARGVMLGVLAGVLLVLVLRRKHAVHYCAMMAATALLGYLLNQLVFVSIPQALGMEPFGLLSVMAERTAHNPASGRSMLWQRCIELIAANPVLGVGPMHFAHHGRDLQIASSPHSWLFQIGAEWGLLALASMCGAIATGAATLLRHATAVAADDKRNQLIATGLLAIGAGILVDGLVSGSLVVSVSQMLIVAYLGCASGWVWSRSSPPAGARPQRLALSGAILAAAFAVFLGVAPDWRHPPGTGGATHPKAERVQNYPRFWFYGGF